MGDLCVDDGRVVDVMFDKHCSRLLSGNLQLQQRLGGQLMFWRSWHEPVRFLRPRHSSRPTKIQGHEMGQRPGCRKKVGGPH